jgi:hypothetical protein
MLVVLLLGAMFATSSADCIFELGEWAFEYCSNEVEEARQKRPDLERGMCEVIQDQIEKFLGWRRSQLAEVEV